MKKNRGIHDKYVRSERIGPQVLEKYGNRGLLDAENIFDDFDQAMSVIWRGVTWMKNRRR
jgi:hypothetical protein